MIEQNDEFIPLACSIYASILEDFNLVPLRFHIDSRCLNFFVNSKVSPHDVAGCSLIEIPLSASSRPKMTGSRLESIHHSTD